MKLARIYNRIGIGAQWLKLIRHHGGSASPGQAELCNQYAGNVPAGGSGGRSFAPAMRRERIRYLFFLLTGERDKEFDTPLGPILDFNRHVRAIDGKEATWLQTDKDKEEREIPVSGRPPRCITRGTRVAKRDSQPRMISVFPTSAGQPDKKA